MPAKDRYHDSVVRALHKDGWEVTAEQYFVAVGERRVWIDIEAVQTQRRLVILVEVKGFERASSVEALAEALGQYMLYRDFLDFTETPTPLYLAVPLAAYRGIFRETIGQYVIQKRAVLLIVFDPEREEIVQWVT